MKKKYINTVSKKRMITNSILIDGVHYNVGVLLKDNPLFLWNSLHTRGVKLSIDRTAYAVLKNKMREIYPDLVKEVERTKSEIEMMAYNKRIKKQIEDAIKNNKIGEPGCRFKRSE
jgi:hypothetical protein